MPPGPAAADALGGAGDGVAAGPAEGEGVEGAEAGGAEGGGGDGEGGGAEGGVVGVGFVIRGGGGWIEVVEGEDGVGDCGGGGGEGVDGS